jgi:hypothetical protein
MTRASAALRIEGTERSHLFPSSRTAVTEVRPMKTHIAGIATGCLLASTAVAGFHTSAAAEATPTTARSATVVGPQTRGPVPQTVTAPLGKAKTSLTRAIARLQHNRYHLAVDYLRSFTGRIGVATHAARNQIGKPPTDPESDDKPGPPSVQAVIRVQHAAVTGLLPRFDGLRRPGAADALRHALHAAVHRRDNLLSAVVALKPGPRGDYADGLADTLPTYNQEISALGAALASFQLPAASRTTLVNVRAQVRATQKKMDAAFGGGE